ncbi:MAG: hypothetical protein GY749_19335 [Desulfobacteraceae bacterium]|nr:hypothetical protein [Desulfobacteraceae bacterium]
MVDRLGWDYFRRDPVAFINQSIELLQIAIQLSPNNSSVSEHFKELAAYAQTHKDQISGNSWYFLCVVGGLRCPANVMTACEKLVEIEPEPGRFTGIRGIAKALTNDIPGAVKDFEANLKWLGSNSARSQFTQESLGKIKQHRTEWIKALRSGKNPLLSLKPEEVGAMSQIIEKKTKYNIGEAIE